MLGILALLAVQQPPFRLASDGLHGYINMRVQDPPEEYGYGVSLYSAAWPLLKSPIANFQIGLASTWILPDNRNFKEPLVPHGTVARDSMPERGPSFWTVFQTIEGGLGFWASNRYMDSTAKFRMNGSTDGYNHEVSTPGWDFYGRPLPADYMGIAQLSSRILVPPDGVTFDKDTCGQLFGYAWMALPLFAPKTEPVATGSQTWTVFFNASNFRGPVAFYLPSTWSKMSERYQPAVGRGMDALRGIAQSGAIEINTVPQFIDQAADATEYSRIPELQFPCDKDGQTVLMHNMTAYSKKALWDQVEGWMNGGKMPGGTFQPDGAFVPKVTANPLKVTQNKNEPINGVDQWTKTVALDDHTFGLQWTPKAISPWKQGVEKASFPNYFRRVGHTMEAIDESVVPRTTSLIGAKFPAANKTKSYVPSDNGEGVWMHPGPKAGPFQAKLADGSVVTYYWYRFVDQPTLQHEHLSEAEKAKLQAMVEKIHRNWTPDKQYMAPPKRGKLATLDPALIVKPPKGLEVGYVPVAIRQDPVNKG
ncbi:MAG: hypothetical protein JST12_08670 [Armatimonadetes bacterium]|nr:hypothetical protein [Armatimonadota bacterium]